MEVKKVQIFFTTVKPKQFEGNAFQRAMCYENQRKVCEKTESCQVEVCKSDADEITGYGNDFPEDKKNPELIKKTVDTWRKFQFVKCKKIEVTVKSE